MGVATLLVIFGHSEGNGVVMSDWMKSLCGLASVGVDIFLLMSGLGLWYSLKINDENVGIKAWYIRRYKRILIPYVIIMGFQMVLSVLHGMPISQAIFELSTLSYWVNHRGAWFIAMLIPVYAFTPIYYSFYNSLKDPIVYSLMIITIVVILSAMDYPVENIGWRMVIDNIKHVLYHLPSFLIGFTLGSFAEEGKNISYLWVIPLPLIIVVLMKVMQWGYWPGFLVLPFITLFCLVLKFMGSVVSFVLHFFGKISLESYLFNGIVGTWIIWYLPSLYNSPFNKGCYLSYCIVFVVGTALAFLVHLLCNKLFFERIK